MASVASASVIGNVRRTLLRWGGGAWLLVGFSALAFLDSRPLDLLLSPDLISYILIAKRLAAGQFADSISSYWGPLYSWLIVAVQKTSGMAWEPSTRIVNIFSGCLVISGTMALGKELNLTKPVVLLSGVTAALYILVAMTTYGVDTLFAGLFLWCCVYVCRLWDRPEPASAVRLGLLMGALYLTKSFGLPLSSAMLLVLLAAAWRYGGDAPNPLYSAIGLAATVMALACLPWIAVISIKLGYPTFGTSGKFNHDLFAPGILDFPMHTEGLLDAEATWMVSAWHDPTRLPLASWSAAGSFSDVVFLMKRFAANMVTVLRHLYWGGVAAAALMIAAIVSGRRNPITRFGVKTSVILLICAAYIASYAIVTVESRYLYGAALALWVCCLRVTFMTWRSGPTIWIIVVAVAMLNVWPKAKTYAALDPPRDRAAIADEIKSLVPRGARVASIGDWHDTIVIAYYNGYHYLGHKGRVISDEVFQSQLTSHGVEYLFQYEPGPSVPAVVLERATLAHKSRHKGLSIWRLR